MTAAPDQPERPRRRAAVLGSPIHHSLSPVLWQAAYAELGLDWAYDRIECTASELPALLSRLATSGEWVAVSLTMPLKLAALPLVDTVDAAATVTGAVNTVVFRPGGRRAGHNTDVPGLVAALRERGVEDPGVSVVLGGGATARSAVAALAELGQHRVAVAVRDAGRSAALLEVADRVGVSVVLHPWSAAAELVRSAELTVNTTPAGAADPLALDWPAGCRLVDVVYHPWPTALAAAAGSAGAPVLGGMDLLVHQAADAVRLVTGRTAPLAAMRRAGQAALAG